MRDSATEESTDAALHVERRTYRAASPTEMIYIATRMVVVSRSTIVGTVSREAFEAAVGHLEARYGILRAVVENGRFMERNDQQPTIAGWLSPAACSVEAMYANLLNADLDTQSTLYRVHAIANEDTLDVFLLTSHAITDATSLIELHSCLAHLCDCVVRGETPAIEKQPFPTPVDEAVAHCLALLPEDGPPAYAGSYAEIPMRAPYDGGPVRHRLERIVIDTEGVERIKNASHAAGTSLHSLLLAAFALAIREVAEGQPGQILVRSSVDMRRRLEPHVSSELVFTAITGHITPVPDLDQPIFDVARLIYEDIHHGFEDGRIFRDYVNYPKVFGSPQQPPVAINVSDMQAVQFHWPTARLTVTQFEYALGWLKKFPNVSVSVYGGRLVANIVYVEEFAAPDITRKISDKLQSIIETLEKPRI